MNDVVYVIMAAIFPETWIHSICKDELTAEEACAKMNADDKITTYYVEEHELYG